MPCARLRPRYVKGVGVAHPSKWVWSIQNQHLSASRISVHGFLLFSMHLKTCTYGIHLVHTYNMHTASKVKDMDGIYILCILPEPGCLPCTCRMMERLMWEWALFIHLTKMATWALTQKWAFTRETTVHVCALSCVCDEHVWKMYRYTSRIFQPITVGRRDCTPLLQVLITQCMVHDMCMCMYTYMHVHVQECVSELKIMVVHWPFLVHFGLMTDQGWYIPVD